MKHIIISVLQMVIGKNGSIKLGKKAIKTERDLLSLSDKQLISLYNKQMMYENRSQFEDLINSLGCSVTKDYFREYMIDKLLLQADNDVVYCPEIEDELYLDDGFFEENDACILTIYNHNMFDHEYIKII